jgi:hypothetical protein
LAHVGDRRANVTQAELDEIVVPSGLRNPHMVTRLKPKAVRALVKSRRPVMSPGHKGETLHSRRVFSQLFGRPLRKNDAPDTISFKKSMQISGRLLFLNCATESREKVYFSH